MARPKLFGIVPDPESEELAAHFDLAFWRWTTPLWTVVIREVRLHSRRRAWAWSLWIGRYSEPILCSEYSDSLAGARRDVTRFVRRARQAFQLMGAR